MTRYLAGFITAAALCAGPALAAPITLDFEASVFAEANFDTSHGLVGEAMTGSFTFDVDGAPDEDYAHPDNPDYQINRWWNAVSDGGISVGGLNYGFTSDHLPTYSQPYVVGIDNYPQNHISAPNDPPFQDLLSFVFNVSGPALDGYPVARIVLLWRDYSSPAYPDMLTGPEVSFDILDALTLADADQVTAYLYFQNPGSASPTVRADVTSFTVSPAAVPLPAGMVLLGSALGLAGVGLRARRRVG